MDDTKQTRTLTEFVGMKNYNVWDENTLNGIKSSLEIAEKTISELQDKAINIQNETKRKKNRRKRENRAPVNCRTTSVT